MRRIINKLTLYFKMQEDNSSQEEIAEVWKQIKHGIDKKKKRKVRQQYILITTAAATFCGFVWIASQIYNQSNSSNINEIAEKMLSQSQASQEIQLIMSDKEIVNVQKGSTIIYSQTGKISINDEEISNKTDDVVYDQIIVPKGKYTHLILADGSSMHINAGTKVIFPKQFKKDKREIFVDGEVYLDVTPNKNAPFIVETSKFNVEVLGTSFDINAYSSSTEHPEVVLVHGKVNIRSKTGTGLTLTPNNKAEITTDGTIKSSYVNAEDYVLWTKGIQSLDDEPLKKILERLSRYYGVTINCSDNIANIKIGGKVDLKGGIENVLKRISITGRFVYFKQENSYLLKPEGNN